MPPGWGAGGGGGGGGGARGFAAALANWFHGGGGGATTSFNPMSAAGASKTMHPRCRSASPRRAASVGPVLRCGNAGQLKNQRLGPTADENTAAFLMDRLDPSRWCVKWRSGDKALISQHAEPFVLNPNHLFIVGTCSVFQSDSHNSVSKIRPSAEMLRCTHDASPALDEVTRNPGVAILGHPVKLFISPKTRISRLSRVGLETITVVQDGKQ